jgi:hypothetical protein
MQKEWHLAIKPLILPMFAVGVVASVHKFSFYILVVRFFYLMLANTQ